MKLLFVSNQFPPDSRGGYENLCKEVATAFVERGHEIAVVTSLTPGAAAVKEETPFPVHRVLRRELEGGLKSTVFKLLGERKASEAENLRQVRRLVTEVAPDGVLIWGMWNMPRAVPAEFERALPEKTAYYLCDYWPSLPSAYIQRWEEPARRKLAQIGKSALAAFFLPGLRSEAPVKLGYKHVFTVSDAVRSLLVQKGVAIANAQTVYGGTQITEFLQAAALHSDQPGHLRLVWIGRLEADKGLHTAIAALAQLRPPDGVEITLNIYGKGDPDYTAQVQAQVEQQQLGNRVKFCGVVPRHEIPAVLAAHDVLLFTSEWEEPFARSPLEALLVGLSVISTTTGGSGEALVEGKTALTYPAGDAATLARKIEQMAANPALRSRLAEAGRQLVIDQFSFERTVDELEAAMRKICG